MRGRPREQLAIGVGLVLSVVGLALITVWGGVQMIQAAGSPAEFTAAARAHGNRLRLASSADIVVFVPGYVLVLGGALAWLRRSAHARGPARRASWIGSLCVALGAVADQVENVVVRLGIGTVDLDGADPTDVVAPDQGLIDVLRVAYATKFTALIVAVVIIAGLAVTALIQRAR